MKTLMDLTWAALRLADDDHAERTSLLVELRNEYALEYLDQCADAGLVIWRSMQRCDGKPDRVFNKWFNRLVEEK